MGRLLGVRERDLPETWPEFRAYVDDMVRNTLEPTEAAHGVLRSLVDPAQPPVRGLSPSAWKVARLPAIRVARLGLVGLLPPILRKRLGLDWTRRDELELRAIGRLSRATTPLLPQSLRRTGPSYLRWRREAIERGDVANPDRLRHARAAAA
jgi:uncharacterized protein (DUF2236 family)